MTVWLNSRLPVKSSDTGNQIPILCYHRVLPDFTEHDYRVFSVSPEQFDAQMAFLAEAGFITLSLGDYAEIARGLRPIPKRSVVITFDDGYADFHAVAWQIAKKHGLKINLFVCTGFIGQANPIIMGKDGHEALTNLNAYGVDQGVQLHLKKFLQLWRPLTWQELAEMQSFDVEFGFHSHLHRKFSLLTSEEIVSDLQTGMAVFQRQLGYRPQFFALPYGWYDSMTPEIINILKHFDLNFIFGTHYGRAQLPAEQNIFPRLSIYPHDDLATFRRKIFGVYDWVGKMCRILHLMRVNLRKGKR